MENNRIGMFIWAFVLIVIGLVFFQNTNTVVSETQNLGVANETGITVSGGSYEAVNTPTVSLISFNNGTVTGTAGTTVNLSTNGTLQISRTIFTTTGPFDFKYDYQGTNYITDSSARSVTGLIPVFFALVFLALGAGFAYAGFKGLV